MVSKIMLFAVVFTCLLMASTSMGSTITTSVSSIGPGCATCSNGVYTLTINPVSYGTTEDEYSFDFNVNTTTFTGVGTYIGAVAIKPANAVNSVVLLSAPAATTYTSNIGGLNAGGCSGSGSGYFCFESVGLGAAVANLINDWSGTFRVNHNVEVLAFQKAVKAQFTDGFGVKSRDPLLSENTIERSVTPTPEPTTALLLGGSLLFLTLANKKLAVLLQMA